MFAEYEAHALAGSVWKELVDEDEEVKTNPSAYFDYLVSEVASALFQKWPEADSVEEDYIVSHGHFFWTEWATDFVNNRLIARKAHNVADYGASVHESIRKALV